MGSWGNCTLGPACPTKSATTTGEAAFKPFYRNMSLFTVLLHILVLLLIVVGAVSAGMSVMTPAV